ncbi:hypothetical protein Tco_0367567 [Tanacetum coccineum]
MAALPPRDQRHLWLRYEGQEYTDADIVDLEERLGRIYDRRVHRVHTFDFGGLTAEVDLGFQLGEVRHRMSWRHYILAMGFHRAEELDSDGFCSGLSRHSSLLHFDYRLFDEVMLQADHVQHCWEERTPKKVTSTDLFYLRSMDMRAQMSRGHFVVCLADHFGLLTKERLHGLTVVVCDLTVIDMDELVRFRIYDRLGDTWADPTLVQAPQAAPPAPRTMHDACKVREEVYDYERALESIGVRS